MIPQVKYIYTKHESRVNTLSITLWKACKFINIVGKEYKMHLKFWIELN